MESRTSTACSYRDSTADEYYQYGQRQLDELNKKMAQTSKDDSDTTFDLIGYITGKLFAIFDKKFQIKDKMDSAANKGKELFGSLFKSDTPPDDSVNRAYDAGMKDSRFEPLGKSGKNSYRFNKNKAEPQKKESFMDKVKEFTSTAKTIGDGGLKLLNEGVGAFMDIKGNKDEELGKTSNMLMKVRSGLRMIVAALTFAQTIIDLIPGVPGIVSKWIDVVNEGIEIVRALLKTIAYGLALKDLHPVNDHLRYNEIKSKVKYII
jgi:hypothetical protein